jgi:Xaa-Pro aminopeptidase
MKYLPINPVLFTENRKRFCANMLPNSVAFFNSNDEFPRGGDQFFKFKQNADLFYLSGIDQEKSILMLFPDAPLEKFKEVLFLRETNEHIAVWEGHKYTKEEATATSGVKTIIWLDSFPNVLKEVMAHAENVYLNSNEHTRYDSEVPYRDLRFGLDLKTKFPFHQYHRSAPIMVKLRTIKQDIEIELIKQACGITRDAFIRLLGFVKPGVMEFEVQAEIEHEFIRKRSDGHAYTPIIASGKSACILHYIENNRECKDGDLLLLDFGAEYANYASDLSRTIPVNGKFSPRQKDCYNAILRVMKNAIQMLVPGTTIDVYHKEVCKMMEAEMIGLGLFTQEDVKNQDPDKPLYMKYYPHGTSHYLGLDVHDLGYKQTVLEEGMVFTCEPGLYIPEEGIGIRIENDILVTNNGPVDLMSDIPVEVDEIEAIMAKQEN